MGSRYWMIMLLVVALRTAFGQDNQNGQCISPKKGLRVEGVSTIMVEREVLLKKGDETRLVSRFPLTREDYDRQGRLTASFKFDQDGTESYRTEWEYSPSFVLERHRGSGGQTMEVRRWFAADGRPAREMTTWSSANEVVSVHDKNWFQTDSGFTTAITQVAGKVEKVELFEHRSNGSKAGSFDLSSITTFSPDGMVRSRIKYNYDEFSRCVELVESRGDGTLVRRLSFTYDKPGRKLKQVEWEGGAFPYRELSWQYNADTSREERRTFFDKVGRIKERNITEFNKEGEVIRVASFQGDGLVPADETQYIFTDRDARGNWTLMETRRRDGDADTSSGGWVKAILDHRAIAYYPD